MKKTEFMKYLENVDREDKANYVLNNGGVYDDIIETADFVQNLLPDTAELAKIITKSGLTLDYDYVRTADYSSDYMEADTTADLVTDDEIDDYFDSVEPEEYDVILIDLEA